MAEIPVEFPVKEPKLGNVLNQFKALKQELREAQGELAGLQQGTEAFANQAARVGEIKDRINDINSSVKAVSGEPIENLTGSFSLLQSQVSSLDFKGAASSLTQLTQSAKALDFKTLTAGVKDFGKGIIDLGKTLLASPLFILAATIGGIVYVVKQFIDTNEELAKSQEKVNGLLKEADERMREYTKAVASNEIQLKLLRGEITKQQAEILEEQVKQQDQRLKLSEKHAKDILNLAKDLGLDLKDAEVINGKLRFDEYYKGDIQDLRRRIAFNEQVKDLEEKAAQEGLALVEKQQSDLKVINEKFASEERKRLKDEADKKAKAAAEAEKKRLEAIRKARDEFESKSRDVVDKELEDQLKETERLEKEQKEKKEKKDKEDKEKHDKELKDQQDTNKKNQDDIDKARDLELLKEKANAQAKLETQNNYFKSVQALSDTFFNIQAKNAEGDVAKLEKLRRQQFQADKFFRAGQATLDTYRAITNTLANPTGLLLPGVAQALAISQGIFGFAQVAKILSTPYRSSGVGGAASGPSQSIPESGQTPEVPLLGPQTLVRGQQNAAPPQRVYVLESDIKNTMNRVNVLEERASF